MQPNSTEQDDEEKEAVLQCKQSNITCARTPERIRASEAQKPAIFLVSRALVTITVTVVVRTCLALH
ncbi:hypothetical protein N656DRAFT_778439, partial [Canariomyces notabilis]